MSDGKTFLPEAIPPRGASGLEAWLRMLRQEAGRVARELKDLKDRVKELEERE